MDKNPRFYNLILIIITFFYKFKHFKRWLYLKYFYKNYLEILIINKNSYLLDFKIFID